MGKSQYLTLEKKAKRLGISYRTLNRWIQQGLIIPIYIKGDIYKRKYFSKNNPEHLFRYKRTKKHEKIKNNN